MRLILWLLTFLLSACAFKPVHLLDTELSDPSTLAVVKLNKEKITLKTLNGFPVPKSRAYKFYVPPGELELGIRAIWYEDANKSILKGNANIQWLCLTSVSGEYLIDARQPGNRVIISVESDEHSDVAFVRGKCSEI